MTVEEVLVRKRWMRLALPDDVQQCIALARLMAHTPHGQGAALDYLLRQLRHEVWDRYPSGAPSRPSGLRPSKLERALGYRLDSRRKHEARSKVPVEQRTEIARLGWEAMRARVQALPEAL